MMLEYMGASRETGKWGQSVLLRTEYYALQTQELVCL